MEANVVFIIQHILIRAPSETSSQELMGSAATSLQNIIICVSLWFSRDRRCDGSEAQITEETRRQVGLMGRRIICSLNRYDDPHQNVS